MKKFIQRLTVMSAAIMLFCVTTAAQSVKSTSTNEVKSKKNLVELNSSPITFSPATMCFVYVGEKVDVYVYLPAGYDDFNFENNSGLTDCYRAEKCIVNGQLAIRIHGESNKLFTDIKKRTLTISGIEEKPEYNTKSTASIPMGSIEVWVSCK